MKVLVDNGKQKMNNNILSLEVKDLSHFTTEQKITYLKKNKTEEKVELTPTQKILKIGKVLEQQISPQLQKDGGDIELVDIDGDVVKVKLIGVCSGCKNASMTLKNFVEAELKEKVDSSIIVEQVG